MTPFGLFLENIRRSRHLQQKQLAANLGVQACYISSLEKGRKTPPSKQVLEKLIIALELDEEEQAAMWDSAEQSQRSLQLPNDMILAEYRMVSELRKQLGRLSEGQITIILDVLALSTTASQRSNTRRMNM
ncbi:MAG TPA: helix-turn-helix transcriptional regulator [Methylobacter sp.]|jgi:transcriptional regulator with XRE-family HTH domain